MSDNLRNRKAPKDLGISTDQSLADEADRKPRTTMKPAEVLDYKILFALVVASLLVRLLLIVRPDQIVFDEIQFGGFARSYVNGDHFMDSHPPLGKLMFAAIAKIAGYDGVFAFNAVGKVYSDTPYAVMRALSGIFGAMLVPMTYTTLTYFGVSLTASLGAAIFVMLDNALTMYSSSLTERLTVSQSRLIALDASFLFFIALATMAWSKFMTLQEKPFTDAWWASLVGTGTGLGLAISVKFVGVFSIVTIGIEATRNLWTLLGNMQTKSSTLTKHLIARCICLAFIPAIIYVSTFYVHFALLTHKGTGSTSMSPEFQYSLIGNEIPPTFVEIGYNSKVYIRHEGTTGGYLHSHNHVYETGSKQQQVTCYPHRDKNNYFNLLPPLEYVNGSFRSEEYEGFVKIKNEHDMTKKMLHSHDHRMPTSDDKESNEVSAYGGGPGFTGDTNDHWKVVIGDKKDGKDVKFLSAILSRFRLVHVNSQKTLFSHSVKLPKYAFGQQEVGAGQRAGKHLTLYSLKNQSIIFRWRIESNEHPLLPPTAPKTSYRKIGFWRKFTEVHLAFRAASLDVSNTNELASHPNTWPGLKRGILYWNDESGRQIYFIGNAFVWLCALGAVCAYPMYWILSVLIAQRKIKSASIDKVESASNGISFVFTAWCVHYLPYFFMAGQSFIFEYLPALWFSILVGAVVFDMSTVGLSSRVKAGLMLLITVVAFKVFTDFFGLTYGFDLGSSCESLKYRSGWNFACIAAEDLL